MEYSEMKRDLHTLSLNSSELRKKRLMTSALNLFSEFGFHGVAVPRIAKDAGVSTGSLYNYFESKEELVNELFWNWKQTLKSYYLTDYPIDANASSQFEFIWGRLHRYASDFPEAFQFIEGQLHSSYLNDKCVALEEEVFEIGRVFVRLGQSEGAIVPVNPQLIVALFFGAFVQYFRDSRADRQYWSLENSLIYRELCWKAISSAT